MFKNVIKEQLKVPAHIDYLGELRDFVVRVGRKYGVSEKIINSFKLAIDEAGTNIIRHAYRDHDEPGFILLRVIVRKASITVSLIDQGKYFDPRTVGSPDLKRYVDIGKKGGLGIFIIRKLMDEIDYRRTEEGNELRLTKYRVDEKKQGVKALPEKVKGIPLSLKAKYFIRTALAITLVIAGVYSVYYYRVAEQIRNVYLDTLTEIGHQVTKELIQEPHYFKLENLHHLYANVLNLYKKYEDEIYELYVIDKDGLVEVSSDTAKIISGSEKVLTERQPVRDNIFLYTIEKAMEGKGAVTIDLYDFIEPIRLPDQAEPWGELHARLLKSRVDAEIWQKRWEYGRLALSILLMSYIGTLLLIYLLLNPFKKLADWIRALDHGEVQDEMDIDSSTEIGEIAKAFSEITTKFRESQKNLAEQEQLQKEMQVAQEIQQTLLPTEFPEIEGYEIASYYEAAKEVGGDYFDFVEVDKDTIGIVVADVSGKGVPGSLVMTMIRTALRTEARGVKDAAEVLARVNDFVVNDMKKGMFVTIFYVIIDSKRRRLNYASAGHNPMILYRPSTRKTYYLNPKGFPIGIQLSEKDLFRKSIESDTIQLAEDDILLLYTDGITEAMNSRRDLFGEERLLKVIREYGHLRVKPFIEKMKMELTSFTEGQPQYDDITLVAIKEKTSPEKEELRRAKLAHQYIAEGMSIREACEKAGITTYAYYNKYKKQFEQIGVDNYEVDETIAVEAKHISIEDKVKIFDIIKNHPEYGAKRISEELNTEKYGYTVIPESKIYEELVRSRLNTRQLREAWVARGGRNKRRLKPPGTPMLTLDGRIIMDQDIADDRPAAPPPPADEASPKVPAAEGESSHETAEKEESAAPTVGEAAEDLNIDVIARPLEEVLDKTKADSDTIADPESHVEEASSAAPEHRYPETEDGPETEELVSATTGDDETISFEKLFEGGDLLESDVEKKEGGTGPDSQVQEDQEEAASELYSSPAANIRQSLTVDEKEPDTAIPEADDREANRQSDQDLTLSAVEDLLEKEIFNSFEEIASSLVVEEGEKQSENDVPQTLDTDSEPALDAEPDDAVVNETENDWIEAITKDAGTLEPESETTESAPRESEDTLIPEAASETEPVESAEVEGTETAVEPEPLSELADHEGAAEAGTEEALPAAAEAEQETTEAVREDGEVSTREDSEMETEEFEVPPPESLPQTEEILVQAAGEIQNESETSDELELIQPLEEAFEKTTTGEAVPTPAELQGNGRVKPLETESDYEAEEEAEPALSEDTAQQDDTHVFLEIFSDEETPEESTDTTGARLRQIASTEMDSRISSSRPITQKEAVTETTASGSRLTRQATHPPRWLEREKLLVLGLRYYKNRDFDRAIEMFQEAIRKFPDFKEAHSILGNAYFRKGAYAEAFRAYLRVLEIDPRDMTALENIGVIYANQGALDKAIRQWQKILRIDPGRHDIQKKIQKALQLLEEKEIG